MLEVEIPKYGNVSMETKNTEERRKAAYRCLVPY